MKRDLLQRIDDLPKSLRQEVLDFIDFLISKKPSKKGIAKKTSPDFKWQGALKGKYKNTNSVDLQHQIWE
jgi:hypothetical protein